MQKLFNYIAIILCAIFCIIILNVSSFFNYHLYYMNPDVGWHIQVGKMLLAGKHLYSEIIEYNFPLIYYSKIIPILIADSFGFEVVAATNIFHFSLCIIYFAVTYFQVSRAVNLNLGEKIFFITAICYGLFILPFSIVGNQFGQKEHYFIILFLPHFLNYFLEFDLKENSRKKLTMFAGLSVGLAVIIKPHFFIILAITEATNYILNSLKFSKGFKYTLAIIIAFGAIFLIFFNSYFTHTLPVTKYLYAKHLAINKVMFHRLSYQHLSGFLLGFMYFSINGKDKIFTYILALFASGFLIILLQNNSIRSVRYILYFAEILMASYCFVAVFSRVKKRKSFEGSIAAMIILLFIYIAGSYKQRLEEAYNLNLSYQQPLYNGISDIIKAEDGEKVIILSEALNYISPPILTAGKETDFNYSSLWILKGLGHYILDNEVDKKAYDEIENLRLEAIEYTANQINNYKPDIILIIDFEFVLNSELDTILLSKYLQNNEPTKNSLNHYRLLGERETMLGVAYLYSRK